MFFFFIQIYLKYRLIKIRRSIIYLNENKHQIIPVYCKIAILLIIKKKNVKSFYYSYR